MSAELVQYPKLLWSPDGVEVTAQTVEDEARYAAEGYRVTAEPPAEAPAPVPEEPEAVLEVPPPDPENEPATFGPADDDTFAEDAKPKKAAKKK